MLWSKYIWLFLGLMICSCHSTELPYSIFDATDVSKETASEDFWEDSDALQDSCGFDSEDIEAIFHDTLEGISVTDFLDTTELELDIFQDSNDALDLPLLPDLPFVSLPDSGFLGVEGDFFIVRGSHVRYKNEAENWTDHESFEFWAEEEVPKLIRNSMYLSEVWRPEPNQIRQVVLLVAGQQGAGFVSGAFSNTVTGQIGSWRPSQDQWVQDMETKIQRLSVAGRVMEDAIWQGGESYGFDPEDTLLLLAMDAGFNYLLSQNTKTKVLRAYRDWIQSRLEGNVPLRIVLVGSSRGGCLALQLAPLLGEELLSTAIYVGTFDGVCHPGQNEGGTVSAEPIDNPLRPTFYAYRTNLQEFFSASLLLRIHMRQIVGGGPVIGLGPVRLVHAFIDSHVMQSDPEYGFDYQFNWVPHSHEVIGRVYRADTTGAFLSWMEDIASEL